MPPFFLLLNMTTVIHSKQTKERTNNATEISAKYSSNILVKAKNVQYHFYDHVKTIFEFLNIAISKNSICMAPNRSHLSSVNSHIARGRRAWMDNKLNHSIANIFIATHIHHFIIHIGLYTDDSDLIPVLLNSLNTYKMESVNCQLSTFEWVAHLSYLVAQYTYGREQ